MVYGATFNVEFILFFKFFHNYLHRPLPLCYRVTSLNVIFSTSALNLYMALIRVKVDFGYWHRDIRSMYQTRLAGHRNGYFHVSAMCCFCFSTVRCCADEVVRA